MSHILVLPDELRVKLNAAYADTTTHNKWLDIGVDTVDDMIERIVSDLNTSYPVLSITATREEKAPDIKERIGSTGNVSIFVGYFENEKGCVDALFFYIPPNAANANDFIPAKVMPPVFGIYNNIKNRTKDKHIHCMPVFIVNLCTTTRVNNASVKKQIICCEMLDFYYHDVFQNMYHDVIAGTDVNGDPVRTKIETLQELDSLLGGATNNKWFEIDTTGTTLKILDTTVTNSTNATSDIYRLSLYVIPAVYMAVKEGLNIDMTKIGSLGGEVADTLRTMVSKII